MSSESPSHCSEDENPNQTDADLFLRLQNGETDALAILYDRHAALVYGIALHLLTNTTEAEDLTQDIFLILTKQSAYDPQRGSLRTYLSILTRSRALDRLRTSTRRQQKLRYQAVNEHEQVLFINPIEEAAQLERSQEVLEALEQLSTKEREVLRMAYYQGLSQAEIATRLSTALGTVKSRTRRGLLKLRQALSNSRRQS
ncbi:RNA polymerase subunit sigma [Pleurocapsa sp. CCALA 161]|uniref:sigma-70 family RNA polymerase sigma factor n=1 Tax=Pleurocapsa sp. CCALA 161 TaxID=2107688 RepID=UPI000D059151|nr:sigma-70 family RNA polymerase sigma factor [Pleurocapsa sp. CCALA 161]PSB09093.1 RNA polymerase subunit sigma [Pleurocapsa sp. CCALA 161]